jgi:hypothetical protein
MRGSAPRGAETELVLGSEPPRESGKAKLPSGGRSPETGQEWRGRPSARAQALVREQLAQGPKRGEEVQAAAEAAEISEHVEGVELHFLVVSARVQGVEIGDAIDPEQHRLAIDHELLISVLQRGLDDPREAAGPSRGRRA